MKTENSVFKAVDETIFEIFKLVKKLSKEWQRISLFNHCGSWFYLYEKTIRGN